MKSIFALLVLVSSPVAFADIVIQPPGLNIGDQYRLVFVTSGTRNAQSSNIADYNSFVTTQANQSAALTALGTTWTVIGSTSTVDARDNTGTNPDTSVGVPIYNLQGQLNAANNSDLWDGSLLNPIRFNQVGLVNDAPEVFTGSDSNGVKSLSPQWYLGSDAASVIGRTDTLNGWVSQAATENNQSFSF